MTQEFRLPDLGEGLTEAEVVQWMVAEGDSVALNQTLAEVETAKAVVELPSPYEGTVTALHAAAGDTVAVGAPLIAFRLPGEEDEDAAPPADAVSPASGTAGSSGSEEADDQGPEAGRDAGEAAQPNLVGYGAAPAAAGRPARRARRTVTAARTADTTVLEAAPHDAVVSEAPSHTTVERPRSTPPVRAYAKAQGVDLALLAATVGDRVITRADVDEYLGTVSTREEEMSAREGKVSGLRSGGYDDGAARVTRTPIRGVRKRTAEAMVASAFTAPHVTTFHTVDVTATMEFIAALRADRSLDGVRIGPLAVVAKAACLALSRFPGLNSSWDQDAGEIVEHHFVDLGIAAATDRGLIVPVIRDAERLSLPDLAQALSALTATARSGKTPPADLLGGTFSLTNIGVFGVDAGTPILPPGQTGILACGAVRRLPWEHRGEVALRQVMTLSLSFDHRVVDGAEGAQFLKTVADLLENPARAMLLV
ncbi:2-oxo acid dehydrogenase subunit E2 [Microbacterium resistens]|uniref:dihydrolipoamide acetyltransferase family protein n=1 Tax=Microbacterium resistens TaxID=156977 RepID=UPI001C5A37D3|nr:dihydrolipoamide acetyltransferase family protein [Microbacterium resistens]MBW1640675.1 2-oxo acid dehydrogenase subunit E2 [Microbacterium resistens]